MRIEKAREEYCGKLAIIKKKVWNTTYRGIYNNDELDNYDYKYHENKFLNKINDTYVIFEDEEIIGYFSFGKPKYEYKDYKYCLNSLYILKEYQGKGIGREVFNYISDYCNKENIKKYFVNCNKYNTKALGFYQKMGGIICGLVDEGEEKSKHQYYIEFKRS